MKEESKKAETKIELFKYLQISPKDKSWGLAVTTAGYQHVPPNREYPISAHPDGYNFPEDGKRTLNEYQLVYITRGSGYFESASCSRTRIEAGTMFMLFPGEWHTFSPDPETGWDDHWVGFNGSIIDDKIKTGFFTFKNCVFRIGVDEQIINTYHDILNIVSSERKGYQQMAAGLAFSLIGRVYYEDLNHSFGDSYMTRIINQAKAIMKEDTSGSHALEDIAKSLNISYSLFRREFKRTCGISPGQYRQGLKLEKAKELLYSTNLNIAQIAEKLHFECLGQFSTFFRKKTGIPPLEYRKRASRNV
ncbi:MAG: AraC family transcriptional regulator [Bacteroidales bacterium]|nr:AraC family transcriptional regulator [Bacteroidales bacterium]MBO5262661.1 AraC family transcriptional regulator [Bacteroidaceae bacterium]